MTGRLPPLRGRTTALAVGAAVAAVALFGGAPAAAHSTLQRSEPAAGGSAAVGRSTVTLWFSEPVSVAASTFQLRAVGGAATVVTVGRSGAAGRRLVELRTAPLPRANYVLEWRVVSLSDGHLSTGSLEFGIGTRPAAAPARADGLPDGPGFALRWLDLSAIMLAIGALAVSGRVLGATGAAGEAARRRGRTIAALAASAAVVTGAVTPLLRTPGDGRSVVAWLDTTWATLTGTTWGHQWLARELALAIAAVALWSWASRRGPARPQVQVAVAALAAAVLLDAWAGHASALPRQSGVAVLASAVHLAAAGVWAGGIAALALCVIPLLRRHPESRARVLAAVGRSFSPLAAVATLVLLATGLYASGRHLRDLGSVGSTVYGDAVAAKVALLALALLLAAVNTLLVNRRLAAAVGQRLGRPPGWTPVAPERFAAVLLAELAVVIASVGAAAVLTSVPTAREVASAARVTAPTAANVDGLFVTVEPVSAGVDGTRLIVRTHATIRPEPAPISGVAIRLAGPSGATRGLLLDELEPGRYEGQTPALPPGAWRATVAVHRDGRPDAVVRAGWTVADEAAAGASQLESITTMLAFLLLAGVAAAVGFARLRRDGPARWIPRCEEEPGRRP